MEINKNNANYGYTPAYSQAPKKEEHVRTGEEQMQFLTGRLREVLARRTEDETPENGKFGRISVSFDIPDTQNRAFGIVEYDELEPKNTRRLAVGARRAQSDRLRTSYIFKGTKKEIIEYLKSPESQEKIAEVAKILSKSTDDYFASL